jgi:hypothetical protein
MIKKKENKMKSRIKLFGSFSIVVVMGVFLGLLGLYSNKKLTSLSKNTISLSETKTSISSILNTHYVWRHELSETVYAGAAFAGSLDSAACSLGKWLNSDAVKELTDPEIVLLLIQIVEPHRFIHAKAGEIINHLENKETDEAIKKFSIDVLPATQGVIYDLERMQDRYGVLLNDKIQEFNNVSLMFKSVNIVLVIVVLIASVLLSLIIKSDITKP